MVDPEGNFIPRRERAFDKMSFQYLVCEISAHYSPPHRRTVSPGRHQAEACNRFPLPGLKTGAISPERLFPVRARTAKVSECFQAAKV
jgi:hypothetical protein